MKLKLTLLAALVFCGTTVSAQETDEHHTHKAQRQQLTLSNGELWDADEHTFGSVQEMKQLVELHKKSGNSGDCAALQNSLQVELKDLIRGCTMTGPAHEQLHVWIQSLAPTIEELGKEGSKECRPEALKRIETAIESFRTHFH